MNNERFIEANRTAQITAIVVAAIAILAASPWLGNLPMSDEEAAQVWERFHVAIVGACVGLAILWSLYFGRIGFSTLATGEFPPPGTLVVRRTKVRFGSVARLAGWLCIGFVLMIWLFVALMAYAVYLIEYAT